MEPLSQGSRERGEKAIRKAKKEIRSELKPADWGKHGYWKDTAAALPPTLENMPRIHCDECSAAEFVERFERPALPCVISGFADGTPAASWTTKAMGDRFGDVKFKCGEDDDGYSMRVKLKYFIDYCQGEGTRDDSPLYVFDSKLGSHDNGETKKILLGDYTLPHYFNEDLFKLVGEKRRPPYRWFMMGSKRSGTGIHTDPLATSAWNMLLQGHKRWCVFKPGTARHLLKPDDYPDVDREALSWFHGILPSLIKNHPEWWVISGG